MTTPNSYRFQQSDDRGNYIGPCQSWPLRRIHTNDSNTFYNPKPLAFRNRSRALIAALYVTVIVTLFPTSLKSVEDY